MEVAVLSASRQVPEVAEKLEEVSLMVHYQVGVAAEDLQQLLCYHPGADRGADEGGRGADRR